MSSFADLLDNEDLVFSILSAASLFVVYRLRFVSRPLRDAVDMYLKTAFNIDRFLQRRFFANAVAFRSMMAETGCVISGLTALEFFARVQWAETPLELVVDSSNVATVCRYLVDTCGYSFIPDSNTPLASSLDEALLPATWEPRPGETEWACTIVAVFEFKRRYRDKWRQVFVSSPHALGLVEAAILSYPTSKPNQCPICILFNSFCSFLHSSADQHDHCHSRTLPVRVDYARRTQVTVAQQYACHESEIWLRVTQPVLLRCRLGTRAFASS